MKKFIQSLELRLSDLFLFIGFLGFAIFLIFGQEFMQHQDPNEVVLPLWAAIIAMVVMIGAWIYYLYLEIYDRKIKFNQYIAITFLALILLNTLAIFVQPRESFVENIVRFSSVDETLIGTTSTAHLVVTPFHKFIFISEMVGVGMFTYIGLFIFPKRFKNTNFLEYFGYALYALIFVMIIYSYITEYTIYADFIKWILGIDRSNELMLLRVKSFVIHPNAFGMICMLGIIYCCIHQSIKPRLWIYFLMGYFFISMVFSLCKTGLLLSALVILAWYVYRLITTYKDHKLRNRIATIVSIGVFIVALLVVGLPYITKGKVFGKIYEIVKAATGEGLSLDLRTYIWDNCWLLLKDGWWAIGRGFGTVNLQLWPLNRVSHEEVVFPTHSSFMNMLAEGGILFLLAYIVFLVYVGYVIVKAYKKKPNYVFAFVLGAASFFLYSFIETIHYLMLVFLFPIFVIYYQEDEAPKLEEKPQEESQITQETA